MLPEKRKSLIIGIGVVIILVFLVLGIAKLSNYLKDRRKDPNERNDASYVNMYDYIGVLYDEADAAYKLYGIRGESEDYLDIKTFFNIQDAKILKEHMLFYADATNELRYDDKKKEFYLYELDTYFSRDTEVRLTEDYIVFIKGRDIKYKEYGSDEVKVLTDNNISNVLLYDNILYYQKVEGIYRYDLTGETSKMVMGTPSTGYVLLYANSNFIIYEIRGDIYLKHIGNTEPKLITELLNNESDIAFIDIIGDDFTYVEDNVVKKYNLFTEKETNYRYDFPYQVESASNIKNNVYFLNVIDSEENRKSIVVDFNTKKVLKEFKNNYGYVGDLSAY